VVDIRLPRIESSNGDAAPAIIVTSSRQEPDVLVLHAVCASALLDIWRVRQ